MLRKPMEDACKGRGQYCSICVDLPGMISRRRKSSWFCASISANSASSSRPSSDPSASSSSESLPLALQIGFGEADAEVDGPSLVQHGEGELVSSGSSSTL